MINYKKQNDNDLVEILHSGEGIDAILLSSPIKCVICKGKMFYCWLHKRVIEMAVLQYSNSYQS